MSTYLLLRNNKQSGPLSKEEILQLGIKPYDLVWVEGKSAAWRYSGELPEFKEYAPMVEEQPYDRFFKKKSAEPKEKEVFEERKEKEKVMVLDQAPERMGAVSVIMPKQAAPVKKALPEIAIAEESPYIPKSVNATIFEEKQPQVETKYSIPLDEIKDRYVKQLQDRKHKNARRKWLMQAMKKAAIFILIIGCGVLIGFAIKPGKSHKNNVVSQPTENVPSTITSVTPKNELQPTDNDEAGKSQSSLVQEPIGITNTSITNDKKESAGKKNTVDEKIDPVSNPVDKSDVTATSNGERNKSARNDNNQSVEKVAMPVNDISSLVSVKANNYKLRDFGGFRNLELTVNNDAKVALDNVLVELQYLKINDEPIKVDHIPFQSISPGGSLTIRVPDNNRGAKLTYRIIKIDQKD